MPSLLENVVVGPVSRKFSLGMDEFLGPEAYLFDNATDCIPPAKKKKCLSLESGRNKDATESTYFL